MTKELQAIIRLLTSGSPVNSVLATLVQVEGSSYRRPGARLLLLPDDRRVGSISGGCLEDDLLTRMRRVRDRQRPERVVYDTTSENDLVWGVGLGCHGVVHILVEPLPVRPDWARELAAAAAARRPIRLSVVHQGAEDCLGTTLGESHPPDDAYIQTVEPTLALAIFGAGDDAIPLARLGDELGWIVRIADPRAAYATPERFPSAETITVGPAETLLGSMAVDPWTAAVVMTHHYIHDVPILKELLSRRLTFLGLLGPRKRAEKILADLAGAGMTLTPEQRNQLHAPVGLDLGADGPEQVALAIVAEIQSVLSGRNAAPLRMRQRPIHA